MEWADLGAASRRGRDIGLANALRERTHALHSEAERSGIVADLLKGRASRYGYALLLRNLLPAYQQLESDLQRCRHQPGVRRIARPEIWRAGAIAADLGQLNGKNWRRSLALLPAGERYAATVAAAGRGTGTSLIAHAYVRYLGDLNGGRALKRLLGGSLGLAPSALSFYEFPEISDLDGFKAEFRMSFDEAGREIGDPEPVIDEAVAAFRLNIEVALAVREAAPPG